MIRRWFQRSPDVRLRRESWGGVAFRRSDGDLLELDAEGFEVLAALERPRTLPALKAALRRTGVAARLPELASFVGTLERRGFARRVSRDAKPLAEEPLAVVAADSPAAALRAPLVAHWAATYRCNLSCPFCYSESGPHRDAGPAPSIRRRIVERLAKWGVLEIALGGGEPTILSDFPELLAAIRAAGMVPNVTTNGTIHHPAVLEALIQHAGVVHLSADRPDLLDAARGGGVFARLRETARRLRRGGVRLGVNLLLTPDNAPQLRSVLAALLELEVEQITFLKPKGAWAARRWPRFPTRADRRILTRELRTFLAARPRVRLLVDTALRGEWADMGWLEDPEPEVLGCGGGQRHVAVAPKGDVYPCSHARRSAWRMGNLLADDLDALWRGGQGDAARRRYLASCRGVSCACRFDAFLSGDA